MGYLTGHTAPCLVAFGLCKFPGALGKLHHHPVVSMHNRGNFIIALIFDLFQ